MQGLILGFDAFDPVIFERLSAQVRLSNLTKVADNDRWHGSGSGWFGPTTIAQQRGSESRKGKVMGPWLPLESRFFLEHLEAKNTWEECN
jgi:hypothetical protein